MILGMRVIAAHGQPRTHSLLTYKGEVLTCKGGMLTCKGGMLTCKGEVAALNDRVYQLHDASIKHDHLQGGLQCLWDSVRVGTRVIASSV